MGRPKTVAVGIKARTGRAIVVVLGGSVRAPEVLAKTQLDVATTFEEGAVFHAAQEVTLAAARKLVQDREARFTAAATKALGAFAASLGARVTAAALAAPVAKALPPFESIVASHPLVHAAEGELYRRVFAAACAALGVTPVRLPPEEAAARVAKRVQSGVAEVNARVTAMGKAAGAPWAAHQKEAALAAWFALASAR